MSSSSNASQYSAAHRSQNEITAYSGKVKLKQERYTFSVEMNGGLTTQY